MDKCNYDLASTILGEDLISPEEIMKVRKLTYGDDLLQQFIKTLPNKEVLLWLRDNGFILVAGAPSPLSLLEIRNLNNRLFYCKSKGWYAEEWRGFSRDDKVISEWLMLRKNVVPNSKRIYWDRDKHWAKQQKLLSEAEYIPNVAEMAWAITTYKTVRGIWLFPYIFAITSSIFSMSGDLPALIGASEISNVISVPYYWRGSGFYAPVGLASAREKS